MGDAGARRALTRLGGQGVGGLPPEMQAALRPHVGHTSSIMVDPGPEAGATADAMGARAFADSDRIYMGRGEMKAPDAAGLVLHEAVHATLHPSVEAGGTRLVHAKLQGTGDALVAQGGGRTSGGLRRLVGKLTNWDRIVTNVQAYEGIETALMGNGPPSAPAMAKTKPKLLALLAKIEAAALSWQTSNESDAAKATSEAWHNKFKAEGEAQAADTRTKSGRRQAVAMLLPRVQAEKESLTKGTWAGGMSLSDASRTGGQDAAAAGQMNTVDRVIYDVGGGNSFEGFFKADKGFEATPAGQDLESGIRQADPNYGARAVAMYRLDQLLGANVTARAEFATHNNQLGTVTERAQGARASDVETKVTGAEATRAGGGAISAEDPVLQSCLNKLQVLDAIAGQLDRHVGNFYIQSDAQGQVTGVTGIDLDMAFGKDMVDPTQANKPQGAMNYRGVPALVDYDLGQRLLQISDGDVEAAIKGLLSEAEVASTVARFHTVRDHAQALAVSGSLTRQWNAATARQGRGEKPSDFQFEREDVASYAGLLANDAASASKLKQPVGKAVNEALLGASPLTALGPWVGRLADAPAETQTAIKEGCKTVIVPRIVAAAFATQFGVDQAPLMAVTLLDRMLSDTRFTDKLEVAVQEGVKVDTLIEAKVDEVLPNLHAPVGVAH